MLQFVVQDATRDYKFQAKITFEILEGGTQISASACCCALLPRAVVWGWYMMFGSVRGNRNNGV